MGGAAAEAAAAGAAAREVELCYWQEHKNTHCVNVTDAPAQRRIFAVSAARAFSFFVPGLPHVVR